MCVCEWFITFENVLIYNYIFIFINNIHIMVSVLVKAVYLCEWVQWHLPYICWTSANRFFLNINSFLLSTMKIHTQCKYMYIIYVVFKARLLPWNVRNRCSWRVVYSLLSTWIWCCGLVRNDVCIGMAWTLLRFDWAMALEVKELQQQQHKSRTNLQSLNAQYLAWTLRLFNLNISVVFVILCMFQIC